MLLAAGSVIAKFIGALYRIPLTNILGAEGMGMYQLVFPVYALFMTLSTAGIPTALSRIVAEKRAAGEPVKKYLVSALAILTALAALAGILTAALSVPLSAVQGNSSTALCYTVIAPSILFVGVIAGLRGWFQGEMYMLPTALSNIIEQLVKLGIGVGLAIYLMPRGLIYGVCGALAGVTVSELVSMLYLVAVYFSRNKKGGVKESLRVTKGEAKVVFKIAFPIAFVAVLLPLSNFFDSVMIVNVLKWGGAGTASATADYGLFSGPVLSMINMPIVIIMSLAVVIVPAVSASRAERDLGSILMKSMLSIKLTYLIGVPAAFFMAVFAPNVLGVFYPALSAAHLELAAKLLMITSFNIVLLSAMQIYVSLLQALDKTKYAIISIICAIIVKIVLTLTLVGFMGITGAAAASLGMAAVALLGTNISFYKFTGVHLEKNIAATLVSGVIMALSALGVKALIENGIAALITGFAVCVIVYVLLAFLFNALNEQEALALPLGKFFAKLRRAVRFWEYGEMHEK